MPQNRHTVRATLTVRPEVAQQIRNENLKILLYCGLSHSMSPFSPADVAFPNQIEVKVNDVDVKSNFKGMKGKAGTTKPADLTSLVRKFGGQQNNIQVTYALTTKRYAYVVSLVRYIPADRLTERIKNQSVIRKQKVLDDMNKANSDPDIEATSVRMSLKDPVSTMRIVLPVRSSHCTHNQCFDGAMFMQLQEQAPQWSCPVCSKKVVFESLCVDEYFQDILNNTSKSIEKVDVEPNGQWRVIMEEGDQQPNGTSSKARAAYDDDFDDGLVELDQPSNRQINGVKKQLQLSPLSAVVSQAFSINTPPLSSREPSVAQSASSAQRPGSKRPQGAVIDLTLSDDDDDDDPPRPAKRQTTNRSNHQGNHTNSYNTPASLPDPRHQQHRTYNHPQQADNYRPSSYDDRAPSVTNTSVQAPSPSNPPQSPFQASPYAQNSWPAQQLHPPPIQKPGANNLPNSTPGFYPRGSPFAIRPPSQQSFQSAHSSSGGQHGGLRLPPMQSHAPASPGASGYPGPGPGGWRSDYDYGSYSQSPG